MRTIVRTSREHAWFILPILFIFDSTLVYLTIGALTHRQPRDGELATYSELRAPVLLVVFSSILLAYLYRLIRPVAYEIQIDADRVVFAESSKPNSDFVLLRSDIKRFYVEVRRWWHTDHAIMTVMFETNWNQTQALSKKYVHGDNAREFFNAIDEVWGLGYTPKPKPPGLLSTRIRLWPRTKTSRDEQCGCTSVAEPVQLSKQLTPATR